VYPNAEAVISLGRNAARTVSARPSALRVSLASPRGGVGACFECCGERGADTGSLGYQSLSVLGNADDISQQSTAQADHRDSRE
jgi:hypothetical protein